MKTTKPRRLYDGHGRFNRFGMEFGAKGSRVSKLIAALTKLYEEENIDAIDYERFVSHQFGFELVMKKLTMLAEEAEKR